MSTSKKKSFLMYKNWGVVFKKMNDIQAGQLIKSIYDLQDDPNACPEDESLEFVFALIKDKILEDQETYDDVCRTRSAAGKKGNQSRWETAENADDSCKASQIIAKVANAINESQTIAKVANAINESQKSQKVANVADTDTDTDTDKTKKREDARASTRFTPPSVEEVSDYCKERRNDVDAETFVDFYTSKGWKVGNAPMKDWKSCVRTWEKRDRASPTAQSAKPKQAFNSHIQQTYDFDALKRLKIANTPTEGSG